MVEIIKSFKEYFLKNVFIRYTFLLYLISLFVQILIAREGQYIPSKYQYDFLLILNHTREISKFIILMTILGMFEYGGAILPVICSGIFNSSMLDVILRKVIVFIAFILIGRKFFFNQIDIGFYIENYDIFIIAFFIMFFIELLSYLDKEINININQETEKYTGKDLEYYENTVSFYFRLLIYAIVILQGINILYKSLK